MNYGIYSADFTFTSENRTVGKRERITGNSKSYPTFDPGNFRRTITLKSVVSGIISWPIILHLEVAR